METFSYNNSSDIEINDFFSRIKGAASDFARFFDVSAKDFGVCYGFLSNPLNCTYDCSFG